MINKGNRTNTRGNGRHDNHRRNRNDSFGEEERDDHPRHNQSFEDDDHINYNRVMGTPIIRSRGPPLPPRFQRRRIEYVEVREEIVPVQPPPPAYNYPPPSHTHFEERNFSYPVNVNDWNSVMAARFAPPAYYQYPPPVRMYSPVPVLPSPVCPFTVPLPTMPFMPSLEVEALPPIMPFMPSPEAEAPPPTMPFMSSLEIEAMLMPGYNEHMLHYSPEQLVPGLDWFGERQTARQANLSADETLYENMTKGEVEVTDPMDFYLNLPRDVFPTAKMIGLDPNPIIDELCKFNNLNNSLPWLLDLEFGMPREPTCRIIPIYDVKYSRIHCKNMPSAIHPGFDECSEDFKRVLIFYYDCVFSTWYRGYVFLHLDNSIENFQAWLQRAMLNYGLCWP